MVGACLSHGQYYLPWRPSLYYVTKRTGWVGSENGNFWWRSVLYLCWHIVGGWVRKIPKICWHNIVMVPWGTFLEVATLQCEHIFYYFFLKNTKWNLGIFDFIEKSFFSYFSLMENQSINQSIIWRTLICKENGSKSILVGIVCAKICWFSRFDKRDNLWSRGAF